MSCVIDETVTVMLFSDTRKEDRTRPIVCTALPLEGRQAWRIQSSAKTPARRKYNDSLEGLNQTITTKTRSFLRSRYSTGSSREDSARLFASWRGCLGTP